MSESNFGDPQAQTQKTDENLAGNPLIHWFGAFASAGVLAVMVYWGMQLVQRDPSEVPVIRAMEGPARVPPEDPGGVKANYTGLAVNSVQSDGEAEKPSDRVVLAPAPRALMPEDTPVPKMVVAEQSAGTPIAELILESVEDAISDGTPAENALLSDSIELEDRAANDGPITLTVRDVPEGMRVDSSGADVRLVSDTDTAAEPSARAPGTRYAPKISLVPPTRSKEVKLALADATRAPASKPQSAEVQDVPLGTRLIQLGAYDSRETAMREWARISGKHHDLLGGKSYVVQLAETGGRKFYRLRAVGFTNSTESKAMCSALIQRGALCIPVVAR